MALPAFTAGRSAAPPLLLGALDRYVLPTVRSAANPPHSTAAVKRSDRQTDGHTPYRYIDPAPHTMREVPINIVNILVQADTFLRILVRVLLK